MLTLNPSGEFAGAGRHRKPARTAVQICYESGTGNCAALADRAVPEKDERAGIPDLRVAPEMGFAVFCILRELHHPVLYLPISVELEVASGAVEQVSCAGRCER